MGVYTSTYTGQQVDSAVGKATKLPTLSGNDNGKTLQVDSSGNIVANTVSGGMSNPMTTQDDIIIGGASGTPTRLVKGNNGEILGVDSSGHLAYTNGLPYITTAPSSANTNGNLIIVVLTSEPATYYNGYLYYIVEA